MSKPQISIWETVDLLAHGAAKLVARLGGEAIAQRGRYRIAVAGGSTPERTYALLADRAAGIVVDWPRTDVFFSDERFVPTDDPRSNYGMAKRCLLGRIAIPAGNVFRIPTERTTAAGAAADYAATLAQVFELPPKGPPPRFDLILLGLGDDGHTASLFPGAATLQETQAWVTSGPPGVLPPPVERITFTYPILNAARHVAFLVAGAAKAGVVREVLAGKTQPAVHPAIGVCPTDGTLTWMIDAAAAALLPS
jgi:6-phosphogluconolactonase